MKKTIVEKWIEEKLDLEKMKQDIERRLEDGEVGMNEEQTMRGMFLHTIITDAYTRWTNIELAYEYGLVSKEVKDFFYANDLYGFSFEEPFEKFEFGICQYLNAFMNLKGQFSIAWSDPYEPNTENYYGICYQEEI